MTARWSGIERAWSGGSVDGRPSYLGRSVTHSANTDATSRDSGGARCGNKFRSSRPSRRRSIIDESADGGGVASGSAVYIGKPMTCSKCPARWSYRIYLLCMCGTERTLFSCSFYQTRQPLQHRRLFSLSQLTSHMSHAGRHRRRRPQHIYSRYIAHLSEGIVRCKLDCIVGL